MSVSQYKSIKTRKDVKLFQELSNGLHDGYITRVEYNNTGISLNEKCYYFDHAGRTLVLHILVSSLIEYPTFEIIFRNVYEWQIDDDCSEILCFSIKFVEDGMMLWANDCSESISDLKKDCYVICEGIEYRML